MIKKTFFAELHRIIRIKIPASEDLHLHEREEIFLALVKTCKSEQDQYGFWKYSNLGGFEFIDLTTIKYSVGCVYDRGTWYIVDRGGDVVQ